MVLPNLDSERAREMEISAAAKRFQTGELVDWRHLPFVTSRQGRQAGRVHQEAREVSGSWQDTRGWQINQESLTPRQACYSLIEAVGRCHNLEQLPRCSNPDRAKNLVARTDTVMPTFSALYSELFWGAGEPLSSHYQLLTIKISAFKGKQHHVQVTLFLRLEWKKMTSRGVKWSINIQ